MPVSKADIQQVTDLLVRKFHPRKVILFGSRAYGTPSEDSDVDLLIVLPFDGSSYGMAVEMQIAIAPFRGFDLKPRTPDEISWRYRDGDPVVRDAIERGIVVYEAAA